MAAAAGALRRADLIVVYARTRGDVYARPLDANVSVARPSRLAEIDYGATRDAVLRVFRSTTIAANVGGIEMNRQPLAPLHAERRALVED